MSLAPYPYSEGNRLEERNTYFYSAYHGQDFFAAWHASRQQALANIRQAQAWQPQAAPSTLDTREGYDAQQVLNVLLSGDLGAPANRRLAEHLLQRFEVSKRLYRRYTPQFKAVLSSGYDDLTLYIQFAALCLAMQAHAKPLPFLNGLLKSIDTLIAVRAQLPAELAANLAWLIAGEARWVQSLAGSVGLEVSP